MKHLRLTPRQECFLSLLAPAPCIADIGCDHGRLSVALLQRGLAQKVIATDISPASLEKAKGLAEICSCTETLDIRLGDGFAPILPGEVDTAIITGMGAGTIIHILGQIQGKPPRLLLQPMRDSGLLRQWLFQNGWSVTAERISREDNRFYEIITAEYCPKAERAPYYFALPYMPALKADENALAFFHKQLAIVQSGISHSALAQNDRSHRNLCALEEKQKKINEVLLCLW